jgi:hypothetical protein
LGDPCDVECGFGVAAEPRDGEYEAREAGRTADTRFESA